MNLYLARRRNVMSNFQNRLEEVKRKHRRGTAGLQAWVNREEIWRRKRGENRRKKIEVLKEKNTELIEFLENEEPLSIVVDAESGETYVSWELMPWTASKRLLFYLRADKWSTDLANLAQVSTHFYAGVREFMKTDENRPEIRSLHLGPPQNVSILTDDSSDEDYDGMLDKSKTSGMRLIIGLYPCNLAFHALNTLDAERFEKWARDPTMEVTLSGSEDSVFDQVSGLLSTRIQCMWIHGGFAPVDLGLCSQLVRNSTFEELVLLIDEVDDAAAAYIIPLISRAKYVDIRGHAAQLSDPADFLSKLVSTVSSSSLHDCSASTSSFFGLPTSFWKTFLNENLANGTFKSIGMENMPGKITKAPFVLPDTPIRFLKWQRNE